MGRTTFAVLAVLCSTWVVAGQADGPPPHPLHKVGDHWTPYEPPTEFPADVQVYTIKRGDTLWALAKQNLGDPYLWPQIWEKNKYIRDAHWIYPGDPLVLGPKAAEVAPAPPPPPVTPPAGETGAGAAPEGEAAATPPPGGAAEAGHPGAEAPPPSGGAAAPLVALGSEDDVYCFAYLDEKGIKPALTITSAENVEYQDNYSSGDIVYVSGGDAEGVKAGQEYFIVQPTEKLRHPATHAVLGTVVRYLGHLRILCTQDHTATAEIVSSCDAVNVGAWLKPFEAIPIPMATIPPPATRCDPPTNNAKGYIVYSRDNVVTFGAGHMVLLDLGEADQVSPGSMAIVFRENPVRGAPRLVLGEVAVLTTGEHWSSARIIRSSAPMRVGDRVELR
jgi:LysM repeat protein